MKKWLVVMIVVCVLTVLVWASKSGNMEDTRRFSNHLGYASGTVFQNEDYKKVVNSNNQFGLDVLKIIGGNKNGNTLISPVSLFMALSMVYNGADGETKEEMGKVLQSAGIDSIEMNKANASLMSLLQRNSKQININMANSIWLNNRFHFQTEFADNSKEYYHAKIQEINVMDKQSPKRINDWVNKTTNRRIKKMVESPLAPDLVAILINAIYFKGDWKYEFNERQTEKRTFHLTDGATKKVPLMELNEKLPYLETEDFQAVSLPYGDGKWSMKIFLPNENSSLEEFQDRLTFDNWEKWQTNFTVKEGKIRLPKFKIEYEQLMNEPLKELGMVSAFDDERANFSKLVTEKNQIWIDRVKHKSYLVVNEKGTEAAAATSVEMKKEMAPLGGPFQMEVNRPFFFAITEEESGTIVFIGLVSNP
ncbi:serpin family protein [Neobacillus dielmonensis]|uniref:serpin family protein n=1 Tax=Neobacillus dielmonensis TaxID=1347369 RepID=UPI0018A813CC|nr:serpin family protein [Neobacillus dielmonensis]